MDNFDMNFLRSICKFWFWSYEDDSDDGDLVIYYDPNVWTHVLLYHFGASLKDLGNKCFAFSRNDDLILDIKIILR